MCVHHLLIHLRYTLETEVNPYTAEEQSSNAYHYYRNTKSVNTASVLTHGTLHFKQKTKNIRGDDGTDFMYKQTKNLKKNNIQTHYRCSF